jgi:hypothetical protein
MSQFFSTQTFVAASARIDEACTWLASLGISVDSNRVAVYRDTLSALAKAQIGDNYDGFDQDYPASAFVNTTFEATQIIRLFESLRSIDDIALKTRVENSLRGHATYASEKAGNSGRDFAFELSIASQFLSNGHEVSFSDDADVTAKYHGEILHVECKRVRSARQLEKRIKEGLRQLNQRYEKYPASWGILAIAIDKLLNPNLGVLKAESTVELAAIARQIIAEFIQAKSSIWQRNSKDPRTLGVIVVLDAPGQCRSEGILYSIRQVGVNNCVAWSFLNLLRTIRLVNQANFTLHTDKFHRLARSSCAVAPVREPVKLAGEHGR